MFELETLLHAYVISFWEGPCQLYAGWGSRPYKDENIMFTFLSTPVNHVTGFENVKGSQSYDTKVKVDFDEILTTSSSRESRNMFYNLLLRELYVAVKH